MKHTSWFTWSYSFFIILIYSSAEFDSCLLDFGIDAFGCFKGDKNQQGSVISMGTLFDSGFSVSDNIA